MKTHIAKFWSYYVLAASILAPYAPAINAAITQGLSAHPQLVTGIAGVAAWIIHRLPTPSSIA